MRRDLKSCLAVSALMLVAGLGTGLGAAWAQDTLPEGPGMQETVQACGSCHSVGTFRNIRRSSVMWEVTINNMIGFGMTGFDYDTVWTYLTTYMGTSPPPPAAPAP